LNSEMIWKIVKRYEKYRINCEMIWKIRKKIVKNFENMEERSVE
jgi:hypothetical protein